MTKCEFVDMNCRENVPCNLCKSIKNFSDLRNENEIEEEEDLVPYYSEEDGWTI